jgi:hypothetical protein
VSIPVDQLLAKGLFLCPDFNLHSNCTAGISISPVYQGVAEARGPDRLVPVQKNMGLSELDLTQTRLPPFPLCDHGVVTTNPVEDCSGPLDS